MWEGCCVEEETVVAAFTDKEEADAWAAEFGYSDNMRSECDLNPSFEETRAQIAKQKAWEAEYEATRKRRAETEAAEPRKRQEVRWHTLKQVTGLSKPFQTQGWKI